jgi:hypothetical protein
LIVAPAVWSNVETVPTSTEKKLPTPTIVHSLHEGTFTRTPATIDGTDDRGPLLSTNNNNNQQRQHRRPLLSTNNKRTIVEREEEQQQSTATAQRTIVEREEEQQQSSATAQRTIVERKQKQLTATTLWTEDPLSSTKQGERTEETTTKWHGFSYNHSGTEFMRPKAKK